MDPFWKGATRVTNIAYVIMVNEAIRSNLRVVTK